MSPVNYGVFQQGPTYDVFWCLFTFSSPCPAGNILSSVQLLSQLRCVVTTTGPQSYAKPWMNHFSLSLSTSLSRRWGSAWFWSSLFTISSLPSHTFSFLLSTSFIIFFGLCTSSHRRQVHRRLRAKTLEWIYIVALNSGRKWLKLLLFAFLLRTFRTVPCREGKVHPPKMDLPESQSIVILDVSPAVGDTVTLISSASVFFVLSHIGAITRGSQFSTGREVQPSTPLWILIFFKHVLETQQVCKDELSAIFPDPWPLTRNLQVALRMPIQHSKGQRQRSVSSKCSIKVQERW